MYYQSISLDRNSIQFSIHTSLWVKSGRQVIKAHYANNKNWLCAVGFSPGENLGIQLYRFFSSYFQIFSESMLTLMFVSVAMLPLFQIMRKYIWCVFFFQPKPIMHSCSVISGKTSGLIRNTDLYRAFRVTLLENTDANARVFSRGKYIANHTFFICFHNFYFLRKDSLFSLLR